MEFDSAQKRTLAQFSRLHQELSKWQGWRRFFYRAPKGIYCFGSVGRGKTLLMDLFYENLPMKNKMRIHFHALMQHVHAQMFAHPHQKDPLKKIAKALAKKTKLLCLDEMMVDDVADAMILARLFAALQANGVVLVFTSNTAPKDLYRNGVQRQNFLPAIQLIEQHTTVISIGEGEDYRLKTLSHSGVFFTPLNPENINKINQEFARLTHNIFEAHKILSIHGRAFQTIACASDMVWFSFAELCQKPRAYPDFLELAAQFKTVFVTDMPICHASDDAALRRFIHLVDVLYDNKIILILSAASDVHDLYQGKDLSLEFARTQSRLIEMRTKAYWTGQRSAITL